MKKIGFLLTFLIFPAIFLSNFNSESIKVTAEENIHELIYEVSEKPDGTYNIDSLKEGYFNRTEYRVYNQYENIMISSISSDVFSSCSNLTSLIFSKDVKVDDASFFTTIASLLEIRYTGSEADFQTQFSSFDLSSYVTSFYQSDEGFINYWNINVRPNQTVSICDIGKTGYQTLLAMYNSLTTSEKLFVNAYIDVAGNSIKDSMQYLKGYFEEPQKSNNSNQLSKEDSIITILVIATFGMSTITVFYLLKKKNIID